MAHKISGVILSLLLVGTGTLFAQTDDNFLQGEDIFDTLSLDLKVNGSDGPVEVAIGQRIVVSWISEGATRCRAVWSKDDIKLAGAIAGKLSKSVTVKVACVDTENNRADDAVKVNVVGAQPTVVPPPEQSESTRVQEVEASQITPGTPVRKSTPTVQRPAPTVVSSGPGVSLPASYPIRTLVLNTLGNTVQAAAYDVEKEGKLNEIANGQTIKSWKIKYEKKGHARFVCDPPVLNVSFDKKDSKGNKRELFTGISTYPGRPHLQYQKIRMIPLCEAEQYHNPSADSYAGFGGKVDAQLREYFTFLTLRSIGTPAVDVVGFADVSFLSPDAQYNGKSFRYMLLQRDNEQDDEFPFTEQFNLEPTLVEDGKYNVTVTNLNTEGVNGYTLLGDLVYTWTAPGANREQLIMRRDPENVLKNLLVAAFVQDGDRSLLHNEDYGKVKNSDIWKTITYGFDWNMYNCRANEISPFSIEAHIDALPQDQQKIYKTAYYRVARDVFSNGEILQKMHRIIDLFPFPDNDGKTLLHDYINIAFYYFGSSYNSSEFAAYAGVPQSSFTTLPFPSSATFERAQENLTNRCRHETSSKDTGAIVEVSSATLKLVPETVYETGERRTLGYLQADFSVALTAPKNQELSINKSNAFSAQLIGPKTTNELYSHNSSWVSWKSYERPAELAETVGPAWIIPAGKTVRFSVTFKYDLPPAKYEEGRLYDEREYGDYIASLKNIVLAANASSLIPPENKTNTVTILKPLSVACSAFSPSLIPTGREVKWVATAEGGSGDYIYSWSGTEGLSGNTPTAIKSYVVSGVKSATVLVTSGKERASTSCEGVRVEAPNEVTTLEIADSFFVRAKNIIAGAPNQTFGGFYINILKKGQRVTTFPAPTVTARTITLTLSSVRGDAVHNVTLQTGDGTVLAGTSESFLKGQAFIVLEGPLTFKDGETYVLRGTLDSSVPVGTQVTAALVGINTIPEIKVTTPLPITVPPGTVVAPTAPSGVVHLQFASPFFADIRSLFGALFRQMK